MKILSYSSILFFNVRPYFQHELCLDESQNNSIDSHAPNENIKSTILDITMKQIMEDSKFESFHDEYNGVEGTDTIVGEEHNEVVSNF